MPDPSSMRVLAALRANFGLKLLALAIAVFTWYSVRQATSYETLIKDVPVTIKAGSGWSVLDRSSATIDVLFSGTLQDLRFLDREQIKVEVEPGRDVGNGTWVAHLLPRDIRYPGGARVVRVEPDLIRISLDREEDKTVPVTADVLGSPPEGVEVMHVECMPATVVIHGSRQRLLAIDAVRTEPIDLEGRIRSFQLTRSVKLPSASWSARVEPGEVRVAVTLVERRASRDLEDVVVRPLAGGDEPSLVAIDPPRVTVRLEGEAGLLQKTTPDIVVAFVDGAQAVQGETIELPVRISPPVGLRAVSVTPTLVKVRRLNPSGTP